MHLLKPGISLAAVYFSIENISKKLEAVRNAEAPQAQSEIKAFRKACRALEEVNSQTWTQLLALLGTTAYGAVALSWCEGADIDDVWKGWLASGFPLKPLPEFERPAQFLNPALVPQVDNLSAVVDAFAGKYADNRDLYSLAISASIAAQKQPLEFDMTPEHLAKAPSQVAAILKSRLLQKPEQTSEDKAIIETWDKSIKDTEWDVWNKEAK